MSRPAKPLPGKLFLSVLASDWETFWPQLMDRLQERFGEADYKSDPILFTETNYYDAELGTPISRKILSFKELVPQNHLVQIKLDTNALEKAYQRNSRRTFNLDPGLVTHERLVLATGKNFTHRIYLDRGIWADLTLIYTRGGWQDLPWTFPDYAAEKTKSHLDRIRNIYCGQIKALLTKQQ
ncbi:MAG: DUF4416 family protein [Desulfonatronovibrionaceae bacterium]